MTNPELNQLADTAVKIRPFSQNGPLGCATACMANAARFLLEEDIDPTDVDKELGRPLDEDATVYQRDIWLMKRGLSVQNYLNPDSQIIEGFLAGDVSYDDCLQQFADKEYSGDIGKARAEYEAPDYLDFVARLQRDYPEHTRLKGVVGERYVENLRVAEDADVEAALRAGSIVLAMMKLTGSLMHQVAIFPSKSVNIENVWVYDPRENEGYVYDFDMDYAGVISCGFFRRDQVCVVSR